MKHIFELPDFPSSIFEIEEPFFLGKQKLYKDGVEVEQLKEKGKPFLIPNEYGAVIKVFPKKSFPDMATVLEINGVKNQVYNKLKWSEYIIGALPILLIVVGGGIGGAIGALGTIINFNIFRSKGSEISKYVKTLSISIITFIIYFLLAIALSKFL